MTQFVHLHLHSQYSLLDGANRLDDVIAAAKAAGMPAIALTDHGNLFGAMEFYLKAREAGIKPILGMEAYVAQGSRLDRQPSRGASHHLVLLAKNETGYRNLIRLTSSSYLEGFYYKPRIDKELLRQHAEGLIGLSACLKGEINEQILGRREAEAEATAREFLEIFGEGSFYLELQNHGIEDQQHANEILRQLSRKLGIPVVATNDCHYLRRDDAFAHDVLLCIGTQKALSDPDRLRYATDQFYLKGADEMRRLFPEDPQAIENTLAVAEQCHLEIRTGQFHLPDFPVPAGHTLDTYLETVARDGLEERLQELRRRGSKGLDRHAPEVYRERLMRELAIIERMGFSGYFLIVWDFIRHAREEGVPVGPGRGSAAGSLVSYALRITDIDPLEYDLLFERFLNPERVSMPDIDIDFCMRRRGQVIQYVSEKYGRDRVAQIITFGTLAAKAVIRDVGRVLGLPYARVDSVAKLIPDMTRSLESVKEEEPLRSAIEGDPGVRRVVEVGSRLEGLTRHASMHAAGVVIAPRPIQELVPLFKTNKDEIITQWDKDVVEELGLLKMDFLGLRTLTVIDDTLQMLRHQGIEIDLDAIPLDDSMVYRLFSEGRTSGIFQFESAGMRDLLRRAKPEKFEDLAAFNALYRPGALSVGMVEEFIKRKLRKKRVVFILPETKPILEQTYGVIVYQEQVMQIAVEIAGFTMGEADLLRKAMGKKQAEVMAEQREKFVSGAVERGFARKKVEELWEYIEPFAGYGFNKSHSVAYAMLAYKTAYLKTHHPVAFMAAMLNSEISSTDSIAKYIRECRQMGIAVLPPDLNESNWAFTVVGDTIRFGLGAVKGIGAGAVEAVLEARRRVGRFQSLAHFASEVDLGLLNHKVFESLIKSGSLDSLSIPRRALFEALDPILDWAQQRRREREQGQATLFLAGATPEPEPDPSRGEWNELERLGHEKATLGFYLTGNPLSRYEAELRRLSTHTTTTLRSAGEGKVAVGGVVSRVRRRKIRSGANAGKLMGGFLLEDVEGSVQVTLFADQLQQYGEMVADDALILVRGTVRERGGEMEITCEEIVPLDGSSKELVSKVELIVGPEISAGEMLRLRELLVEHPGDTPVSFRIRLSDRSVEVAPEERYKVRAEPELLESLEELLGVGRVLER